MFPKLRKAMIRMMRLNDKTAQKAKVRVDAAIEKLNTQLADQAFLVGDTFTRADLAADALLAPIIQPEQYGLSWPEPLPQPLQNTLDE